MIMERKKGPRIYLAARYSRRAELQGYAGQIDELGLGYVKAAWLSEDHDWDGSQSTVPEVEAAQRFALDDLADLIAADLIVVFTEQPGSGGRNRGGRHVEYGAALALKKWVVIVGPAENVFHTLPQAARFADWTGALAHIVAVKDAVEQAAIRRRLMA